MLGFCHRHGVRDGGERRIDGDLARRHRELLGLGDVDGSRALRRIGERHELVALFGLVDNDDLLADRRSVCVDVIHRYPRGAGTAVGGVGRDGDVVGDGLELRRRRDCFGGRRGLVAVVAQGELGCGARRIGYGDKIGICNIGRVQRPLLELVALIRGGQNVYVCARRISAIVGIGRDCGGTHVRVGGYRVDVVIRVKRLGDYLNLIFRLVVARYFL